MTTTLNRLAIEAWASWGLYAKWTICACCRRSTYCRARRVRGPFLCLDCHDQGGK